MCRWFILTDMKWNNWCQKKSSDQVQTVLWDCIHHLKVVVGALMMSSGLLRSVCTFSCLYGRPPGSSAHSPETACWANWWLVGVNKTVTACPCTVCRPVKDERWRKMGGGRSWWCTRCRGSEYTHYVWGGASQTSLTAFVTNFFPNEQGTATIWSSNSSLNWCNNLIPGFWPFPNSLQTTVTATDSNIVARWWVFVK